MLFNFSFKWCRSKVDWRKKGTQNAEHEHGKCSRFCKYWRSLSSLRHNTQSHIYGTISFSKHFESNLSDNWACIFRVNWNSTHRTNTVRAYNTYSTWCAWRLNGKRRPKYVWKCHKCNVIVDVVNSKWFISIMNRENRLRQIFTHQSLTTLIEMESSMKPIINSEMV